ncbi:MAG: RagB/SusD family nutrient uptake outer membrane protein [Cyclobacteriaceae bacterium]
MKNLLKYIFSFTSVALMISCSDLEEDPVGLLAPQGYFKTAADVQAAIVGGYEPFGNQNLYGRFYDGALQLRGDMVSIGDPGTAAERQQMNNFDMDATNGLVRRFWPLFYESISSENAAIYGAGQVEISDEVRNVLVAEARFVRGFSYYQLVRCYGDIPYIDEFISNPDIVKSISKTPEEEIYQKIIEDFQFAKENLPDQQPGDIRSRPTKGTASSYLASVYLMLEDYENAALEAQWVIDNSSRFNYSLADDYQDLFNAEVTHTLQEPIFVIDFLSNYQSTGNNDQLGRLHSPNRRASDGTASVYRGYSSLVPSMEVYSTWDGRDYRKTVSLDTASQMEDGTHTSYWEWEVPRPAIAKWSRYPGPNATAGGMVSDHDFMLMRYAEILLIAAEALTEVNNGPTAQAIDYVNMVRTRARNWAGTMTDFPADAPTGLNKEEFIDLILEDRRLEFAFEWKRWFDIKRRRLGEEVFKGPESLESHPNFDPSRDYYWPIPAEEIDRYPNILPQNPGY